MLRVEPITDATIWNQIVSSLPISSALQSWGWGEVKRLSGWQPERLVLYQRDALIAAVQLFRRRLFGPVAMLYSPRGPALRNLQDLPEVIETLKPVARGAVYLRLEPETGQPAEQAAPEFPQVPVGESIQPEYTIWLDLTLGPDGLLATMNNMHRRNTRLAARRVVTSIEGPEAFEEFWQLFEETNRRARLMQHSKTYYQTVLKQMNQPLGRAFICISRLDGKALAAGLFVAFAGKVDYLYGGSSRENSSAKAPSGMHWGAINWGIENGYRIYDLWGVPRKSEGSHAAGIDAFKEGFGGSRVRFPAYDVALSPLYGVFNKALRLRRSWINYRARGTTRDLL